MPADAPPPWGDAARLIDLLDVRPVGPGRFRSPVWTDGRRPVVEGSQLLGQSLVAALRSDPGRRVVSAGLVFLRPADARRPVEIELEELARGRTFGGSAVRVGQGGRCCAAGTVLLGAVAPDVLRHEVAPPRVPGPSECPPYDMGVTGRDVRVVDGAYTGDPGAPVGPPVLDCWVRFGTVPDDPALHAGLLAQFTGHLSVAAALRPHPGIGQDQAHRTLSTAVNAISLSLHGPVRADRWMLYHHHSTFAGEGMTHSACRVHAEDGRLLASFSVEAMVRPLAGGAPGGTEPVL
jgi:acyl-CoA thioesterase